MRSARILVRDSGDGGRLIRNDDNAETFRTRFDVSPLEAVRSSVRLTSADKGSLRTVGWLAAMDDVTARFFHMHQSTELLSQKLRAMRKIVVTSGSGTAGLNRAR